MQDILNDYIPNYRLGSKTARWFAGLIDYGICFVMWGVIAFAFGTETIDEDGDTMSSIKGWPALIAISVPWFFIVPFVEFFNDGQSIGKSLFQLKVVKLNGEKASLKNIVARRVVDFIDYLPFFGIVGIFIASNNDNKLRLGDMVGRTKVISLRLH